MVNKERVVNGLLSYIDAEVIPKLPTSGKWVIGTAVCVITPKAHEVMDSLLCHPIVKAMDIVDANGMIDSDKLVNGLAKSAEKYGTMELVVPIVGTLKFTADDVRKLNSYICA